MKLRERPVWSWIVGVLIGVPLLYALSVGPAFRLTMKYPSPTATRARSVVYRPLLRRNPPAVNRVVWWYIGLWVELEVEELARPAAHPK